MRKTFQVVKRCYKVFDFWILRNIIYISVGAMCVFSENEI